MVDIECVWGTPSGLVMITRDMLNPVLRAQIYSR